MERALTPKERRELEASIAKPEDAKQLKRAQVVLAVADGESVSRIAQTAITSGRSARSLEVDLWWLALPRSKPGPVESLWRWLKDRVLSNTQRDDFGEALRNARELLEALPARHALRSTGVMSDKFWLRT